MPVRRRRMHTHGAVEGTPYKAQGHCTQSDGDITSTAGHRLETPARESPAAWQLRTRSRAEQDSQAAEAAESLAYLAGR
jgi:hypothetical protein